MLTQYVKRSKRYMCADNYKAALIPEARESIQDQTLTTDTEVLLSAIDM